MPSTFIHHPFQNFVPDVTSVIFEYFVQVVPDTHPFVDSFKPEEIIFLKRFILSWEFDSNAHVKEFLKRTRGDKLKLYHVSAEWNTSLDNETFEYFRGITSLDISHTQHAPFTDKAFSNLRGISRLKMAYLTCGDVALEQVRGVSEIDISACLNFTNVALRNLRGVKICKMSRCHHFSEEAFENLRSVREINLDYCLQITDNTLKNFRNVKSISMAHCDQVTDAGMENLIGCEHVRLFRMINLTDLSMKYLRRCTSLSIQFPNIITSEAFKNFRLCENIRIVQDDSIDSKALKNFRRARQLHLRYVDDLHDEDFSNFRGVQDMTLERPEFSYLTVKAFENLYGIESFTLLGSFYNRFPASDLSAMKKIFSITQDFRFLEMKNLKVSSQKGNERTIA